MRRSVLLLSALSMILTLALATPVLAADSSAVVSVANKRVELSASMGFDQVRYFTLDSPKRLVVDLYGVQPGHHDAGYPLTDGFKLLRVGPLEDKTRFVFDVAGAVFPTFNVDTGEDKVVITWTHSQDSIEQALAEPSTVGSAKITAIDFAAENDQSKLYLYLDGQAEATSPVLDGNKVQFALKNTTLPRSLRREFDTLAFPSAIYSATPYLVNSGGKPEVRLVILLKGEVPYRLQKNATGYVFSVNDGAYGNASAATVGTTALPAEGLVAVPPTMTSTAGETQLAVPSAAERQPAPLIDQVAAGPDKKYTGEKTSLVFDNADVRDILRLIAEISELNIIASDAVKGDITLRLIDVPWDQALDLILDVTGLGMIREGNVVRVLPKDQIRTMKEAELTAARSQEKLEPLTTEVVTISYADLGSVSGPAKDLLSDRGSITEDSRNKLLIVTDVPVRIEKVKALIQILDTPERQVMIEARIVEVNTNFSRDLGVNWGLDFDNPGHKFGSAGLGIGGNFLVGLPSGGGTVGTEAGLGAGFTFGRIGIDKTVLDLRISALETDGALKIISMPKVTTLNGEQATISQGTTIPYQTSGSDGPKTEFVSAELKLEVTPVINPDDSIIMELLATNDSPSLTAGADAPSIDTKKAETKVLVQDGETTVIGGIFVENTSESDSGVPWVKDVPIVGQLFKSKKNSNTRSELLIFITPRILQDN